MFNEMQVNCVYREPLCTGVYNSILKVNCIVMASYSFSKNLNVSETHCPTISIN